MKRNFIYSLLTTVTVFSLNSDGFCGKTDREKLSDSEKFEYYSTKMKKHENDKVKEAIYYTKSLPFFPAYLQKNVNMLKHQEAMEDCRSGKIETAISTLESLAEENHPESLVSLARAYLLQDHFPGRLEKVTTLLERASYLFHREADVQLENLHFVMGKVILREAKTKMEVKQAHGHFTMSFAAYEKAAKRGHAGLKEKFEEFGFAGEARPFSAFFSRKFGLPLEVLEHILTFLTLPDVCAFSNISRATYNVIRDEAEAGRLHQFMIDGQKIEGLTLPVLLNASRLMHKSSDALPYKDWIHRCPEEKRSALIPTLGLLDIFVTYMCSEYPERSVSKTSRRFINREFSGQPFSPNVTWYQNYKKLMPHHMVLPRQFPEILNITCFNRFEDFLNTKSMIFNQLVHLTQEECTWIAGMIPPKGTKTENICREVDRRTVIHVPAEHIIQFLASHEKEDNRFETLKSIYKTIPKRVGWNRFDILGSYVANHLIKIGDDLETRKLYSDVFSSLFNQYSSKEDFKSWELANLLSFRGDGPIYKLYLEEAKEILESDKEPKVTLREIKQTRTDLVERNKREIELMNKVELAEKDHKHYLDLYNEIVNPPTPHFNFGANSYYVSGVIESESEAAKVVQNAKDELQKFRNKWKKPLKSLRGCDFRI